MKRWWTAREEMHLRRYVGAPLATKDAMDIAIALDRSIDAVRCHLSLMRKRR